MTDLAQTLRNANFHQPRGADELAAAYGVVDTGERQRLAVHDLMHTLAERVWICTDKPAGWRSSVCRLDAHLYHLTRGA